MQVVKGDIWDFHDKGEWIAITTNGFVKKNGECVMGAGIAKQAQERFPSLPKMVGDLITEYGNHVWSLPEFRLFTFPVKHNWWENADLDLILRSAEELAEIVEWEEGNGSDDVSVYLVKPGCGNGRLKWKDVEPVISPILGTFVTIVDR